MKKVINITLGSVVFAIEEDAYGELQAYLNSIKDHFAGSGDSSEIASDVESSISEKFFKLGRNEKLAITRSDVENVKKEMGSVHDFDGMTSYEKEVEQKPSKKSTKRFYRDPEDKILGGVASGIANYFGLDALLIRLLFVFVVLIGGSGILVYIVLWLIMPEAKTASQKLEMRGEPVTLSSISESVEDGVENLKKKDLGGVERVLSIPIEIFRIIVGFVKFILKILFPFIRIVVGIALAVSGVAIIVAIILGATALVTGGALLSLDPIGQVIRDQLFANPFAGIAVIVTAFIVALIPALFLTTLGTTIARWKNSFRAGNTISLLVLWLVAIGVAAGLGIGYGGAIKDGVKQLYVLGDGDNVEIVSYTDLESFKEVSLKGGLYTFKVVEGDTDSVRIRATEYTQDNLSVSSSRGKLTIKGKGSSGFCLFTCFFVGPAEILITIQELDRLNVGGGSRGIIDKLVARELSIDSSGSLKLLADLEASEVVLSSSGSSEVVFRGKIDSLVIDSSGSTNVDGSDSVVKEAVVESSGSSKVLLRVSDSLDVDISGSGRVKYIGNPEVSESISGSGSVRSVDEEDVEQNDSLDELYEVFEVFSVEG